MRHLPEALMSHVPELVGKESPAMGGLLVDIPVALAQRTIQ
jgi:hypothetical protein